MNLNWIQKLLPTADFKILSASATKVFSTNANHKFCAAEINHWAKKHSPKTTHPMTNSASSERLHKQFCQTHISTIDRPERRQRDAQQFRVRSVTHIEAIYITKHQTFLRAQITRNLLKQPVGGDIATSRPQRWARLRAPKLCHN